jgi:hypothetical protein
LNPRPNEAQLEDQKAKKAQQGHLEGKIVKPTKSTKSGKPRKKQRKAQNHKTSPEINSP